MENWQVPLLAGREVAVVGGGVLGRRIACAWVAGGYNVKIVDLSLVQRTAAYCYIQNNCGEYAKALKATPGTLEVSEDLDGAVKNAWMVIESVPEKLQLKVDLFAEIEAKAPSDAILCTNSSSYKSREVAEKFQPLTRRRILNTLYTMPPSNRLVELMTSGETEAGIMTFVFKSLKEIGMYPVVARVESTGLVFSRIWAAVKRECLMVLAEGVTVPETLDDVWLEMFANSTLGPCGMMDAVGLDTVADVEEHFMSERKLSGNNTVHYLRKEYVEQGRLGAKSSSGGFYLPGHNLDVAHESAVKCDDPNSPTIYFLDLGLSHDPRVATTSGRILVGGSDGRPIRTLVDNLTLPDGLAVSLEAGRLFWTGMGNPQKNDGSIHSCNLDGKDIQTIVPKGMVHTPKQLCIDFVHKKLYFSDREGLRVMRCNLNGSNIEIVIQTGSWNNPEQAKDQTLWCVGVAVHPSEKSFYWTQKGPSKGSSGRIFRARIDFPEGTDANSRTDIECLFTDLPEPIDLEIDEHTNSLYWTDRGELPLGNSLNRASISELKGHCHHHHFHRDIQKDGLGYEILVRNLHEAIGLKLDARNRHIYVTDIGGCLYRFDFDGGQKKKLYEDQGAFSGIDLVYL